MSHCRRTVPIMVALVFGLAAAIPSIALAHGDPEITVKPASLRAGEEITVLGEGFEGGGEVMISLTAAADSREMGAVMADEEGNFRFQAAVPDDLAAGSVEVRAVSGEDSALARLTLKGGTPGEPAALAATNLEFSAEQEEDGHVLLTATLTDAEGQPIADAPVHFALRTTLLEVSGEVTLAEAATDADGVATAEYEPTFAGDMEAVARFEGVGFYEVSEAAAAFEVTQFEPAYVSRASPLGVLRDWAPLLLAAVVLGVWSTFGFVIYQVFRVARAGGEA
jgi:hypothetical protein